ncbi:MAG: lasso peptide biosynthesis B2 protein [Phycisphaerae bacterium]|nr:lasso peptide biosynthesis B2 protein [Phycisphaerae bacterium]
MNQPRWAFRDLPLLISAMIAVLAFRVLLWIVPLRRLRDWIDRKQLPARHTSADPLRIGSAVSAAGHRIPKADCLPRALALQYLLRRHGIESELCLGVRQDTNRPFTAHAWVTCDGQIVIGDLGQDMKFATLRRAG